MLENIRKVPTFCFFITKLIRDIILDWRYFFMIKIYDTKNCAKCRLTERLFNVTNVDFEIVKPHNSNIQRFQLFRSDLIKKECRL